MSLGVLERSEQGGKKGTPVARVVTVVKERVRGRRQGQNGMM